ncbi:MAG TPA: hypothetical protein VL860_11780 [Planctomycetota bacterium]|nr:hypothetical protein [Planctomycetota bacterium]
MLLIAAVGFDVWSLGAPHWYSHFEYLARSWGSLTLVWLAPFLLWGLFTQRRLARVFAIGVLAGVFVEQALQVGSQLFFIYYILSSIPWGGNLIFFLFQVGLQLAGLFAACRLFFLELKLFRLEPIPAIVPSEPAAEPLSAQTPGLFDRLAPWLAMVPLLFDAALNIQSGITDLWGRNPWDAGAGLIFLTAFAVGAILAARGRSRWRLLACSASGWYAVTKLLLFVQALSYIDRDETLNFYGWADPHGRYCTAWWLLWCMAMVVALRAIFWLVPRDFAAVTAVGADGLGAGLAAEPEDTVAQNEHWDETGPGAG